MGRPPDIRMGEAFTSLPVFVNHTLLPLSKASLEQVAGRRAHAGLMCTWQSQKRPPVTLPTISGSE
jgi:hypothetical protein